VNRLKAARYDAGLSVEQLAEKAGVAKSTIFDLERAEQPRFPRVETAKAIAGALELKPSDLFFDAPAEAAA
jgi:transcriptional regulator with XRE-family HTH domain